MGETLKDYALKGGIEGEVFRGIVGGKYREYTPVMLGAGHAPNTDTRQGIFTTKVGLVLTGDNIPKRIQGRRKDPTTHLGLRLLRVPYHDYSVPLDGHLDDNHIKSLSGEEKQNLSAKTS